jgi:hypothetical protein
VVGIVLLLISLALFGLAAYHVVRLISKGYSYACIGDGCAYETPDLSDDIGWISAAIPFAIITLVASIMAFTFHRIRSAFTSPGSWAEVGEMGSLPLLARTLSGVFSQMRAGQGAAWPGVTWPGMPGTPASGTPPVVGAWPGAAAAWPGADAPGAVAAPGNLLGTSGGAGPPAGPAETTDPARVDTIRATGLDGEAVVTAMHDVGMVSGTKRMYELDLAVTLPGRATYHVKHMTWVPVESVGRLYAGGRLRAKIDAADQNSLVLDLTTQSG